MKSIWNCFAGSKIRQSKSVLVALSLGLALGLACGQLLRSAAETPASSGKSAASVVQVPVHSASSSLSEKRTAANDDAEKLRGALMSSDWFDPFFFGWAHRAAFDELASLMTAADKDILFATPELGLQHLNMELKDDGDQVKVSAEVPGVEADKLNVTVTNDTVTLKGEKGESPQSGNATSANNRASLKTYQSFSRSIALPCRVDSTKAQASLKNGVLTVTAPKIQLADSAGRQLPIHVD